MRRKQSKIETHKQKQIRQAKVGLILAGCFIVLLTVIVVYISKTRRHSLPETPDQHRQHRH